MKSDFLMAISFCNYICSSIKVQMSSPKTRAVQRSSRQYSSSRSHFTDCDNASPSPEIRRKRRRCKVDATEQNAGSAVAAMPYGNSRRRKIDNLPQPSHAPDIDKILQAERNMSNRLSSLKFASPVTHVYNPLEYAWAGHEW